VVRALTREEHRVTQAQLNRAVAVATGETIRDVRNLGFSILERRPESPDPDDLCLVLDCPFCGGVIPYPGLPGDDRLATCSSCDVEFAYALHEVYLAGATCNRPCFV
jgi:hypothetical protein